MPFGELTLKGLMLECDSREWAPNYIPVLPQSCTGLQY